MWRAARVPRQQSEAAPTAAAEDPQSTPTAPQPAELAETRPAPDGQKLLEELRGQPGFGVVLTSSEVRPTVQPQNLGQKLNHELDLAVSRERQVLELIDLASRPARDLTPEQFRRLFEALS